MAPESKASKAFNAMRALGIEDKIVKPVLVNLLKLYNKNWELIEDDNYRTLADAIFELEESEKLNDNEKESHNIESQPQLKKVRLGNSNDKVSSKLATSLELSIVKKIELAPSSSGEKATVDRTAKSCSFHIQTRSLNASTCSSTPDIKIEKPVTESTSAVKVLKNIRSTSQAGAFGIVKRPAKRIEDITKGSEKVKVSLEFFAGNEKIPKFFYIPENTVYQNAYLHFSLARIADEDCCSSCLGDCMASSLPCACARETGGEYAYTKEGLLRKEFLQDCISLNQDPQKHHMFFCEDCPLERRHKGKKRRSCKGHLLRKFVKECWRKCGCDMDCGNRIVQRGITRNLQIYVAGETKGWGVRTLEEIPEGAFVCEYVGEILTNVELYERNKQRIGEKHTYPVLLDADWGSEEILQDDDALCLDATLYGNIGRFVNHRCFDANMLEVPVAIETPDHHYYHLAFFTKRKIEAFEELTWDYGIDFEDHHHPVKAFQCVCGSTLCRDKKPEG